MDVKVEKSELFSLRIIELYSYLKANNDYIIANQILRSGTSIGANIAESIYSESQVDMAHKLFISLKEASETRYWLRILFRSHKISEEYFKSLLCDCEELIKILTSIINKIKFRLQS